MDSNRLKRQGSYLLLGTLLLGALVWLWPTGKKAPPQTAAKAPRPARDNGLQTAAVPRDLVEEMRRLAKADQPRPAPKKDKVAQSQQPKAKAAPQKSGEAAARPAANHTYRRPTPQGAAPPRRTPVQNGAIPELVIDLGQHTPQAMARQYGLVLAAQSFAANTLLGYFDEGQLKGLSPQALTQYASRGRSAAGLADEFTFKHRAAAASGRALDDIGLLYLVPLQVDRQWTAWQRQIVENAGYHLVEVAAVHARCAANLDLQPGHLVLKEGGTIALSGATP